MFQLVQSVKETVDFNYVILSGDTQRVSQAAETGPVSGVNKGKGGAEDGQAGLDEA